MDLSLIILVFVCLNFAQGTNTDSGECQYNFVVPQPDIVSTCKNFNAQENNILQRKISALEKQVSVLSKGKINSTENIENTYFCDCTNSTTYEFAFKDCQDVRRTAGQVNGVYTITPVTSIGQLLSVKDKSGSNVKKSTYWITNTSKPLKVYCDLGDDEISWTLLMRRRKMNVSFDRSWKEYKDGFGHMNSSGDFWIGLETMHLLTGQSYAKFMLWIILTDQNHIPHVLSYSDFFISDEAEGYAFNYGTVNSKLSNEMRKGAVFVSKDFDPYADVSITTPSSSYNRGKYNECPTKGTNTKGGGWWFEYAGYRGGGDCGGSNLNAPKPYWQYSTYKSVEMKIRPID